MAMVRFRGLVLAAAMVFFAVAGAARAAERRLVYEVTLAEKAPADAMEKMVEVLKRRVDPRGTEGIMVVAAGAKRVEIRVTVPGEAEKAQAKVDGVKAMLRGAGVLEFYVLVTDEQMRAKAGEILKAEGPAGKVETGMKWLEVAKVEGLDGRPTFPHGGKNWMLVYSTPEKSMTQQAGAKPWSIKQASRQIDERQGSSMVGFEFDERGATLFGDLTEGNLRQPLAIALDGKVLSAPTVQSRIEARGIITGKFTEQDVAYLVNSLNAGALPGQLSAEPVSEQTVGE